MQEAVFKVSKLSQKILQMAFLLLYIYTVKGKKKMTWKSSLKHRKKLPLPKQKSQKENEVGKFIFIHFSSSVKKL